MIGPYGRRLSQLKIIQEVITLSIFMVFAIFFPERTASLEPCRRIRLPWHRCVLCFCVQGTRDDQLNDGSIVASESRTAVITLCPIGRRAPLIRGALPGTPRD
jgi:hypothetical protein